MFEDRIRLASLRDRVMSADDAAKLVGDGMVVGMSGFTRAGDAKDMPIALARRAKANPMKITLITGASLGHDSDKTLTEAGVLAKRLPFQVDTTLRSAINRGEVMFVDQHLSETVEFLRTGQFGKLDVAVIEAVAITEDGGLVPSSSVGNSASFAILAEKVIVEINLAQPLAFEGMHDIWIPGQRPHRAPLPIVDVRDRVGTHVVKIAPEKIAAIVITDTPDSASNALPPDADTQRIAGHLIEFFQHEVSRGRLPRTLPAIQSGIGTIANAVLTGFIDSPFEDLTMYSEVLQDSTFDLMDAGKMVFASGSSITVSQAVQDRVFKHLERYRDKLVLRPQEVSNHPEVIRRLGLIALNTALEVDIYGNVNSTHVGGTHMMNGIGGSGDFARNARMAIFATKSIAKEGKISSIVPMVPHVDHNEHDVDIIVTEQGLADLRTLAPRERVNLVIDNCAHPSYRDVLREYYRDAQRYGGQTPHALEHAFDLHVNLRERGSMLAGK
ncbi:MULTISPECIES: acetyl-CoA hydrolase/transferase family protein [Pandoraea]|uniref:acetyl-CoA hydrolase/transferase family protein n=1 Tax=Pandoraea TaxID=93217 RepID=UPI001F5D8C2A|nr:MULTISPECIES: acetyl-CoA hydrolase/transferase family protein [Pandoraea]MCI3206632.1 propionyl-CoA--succinate CoA transferase [Pandoraea sp. LA3]MDN4584660.1 propionyl-CoA--succinate CoA transferase [Pandoraea capi]